MKRKLIQTLISNLFTASALCLTAQLVLICTGILPQLNLPRFGINFCVAYPTATLIGMLIPADLLGIAIHQFLNLPFRSFRFSLVMSLCINLIVTFLMTAIMTCLNVIILEGQGLFAFLSSYRGNFLPMYAASCLVSWFSLPFAQRVVQQKFPALLTPDSNP